jgi:CheY-like chemotaxis protein
MNAFVSLVQALAWPLLVLFLVFYFGGSLKALLDEDTSEVAFKAGPSGIEFSKSQVDVASSLSAASASTQSPTASPQKIANVVTQTIEPVTIRRLAGTSILWVDDDQNNNLYERKAFEDLGISVVLATSTKNAIEKLQDHKFDVIISDMARPPDRRAAYVLLAEKQKLGIETPYIIYAGPDASQYAKEARSKGAIGSTNDPLELYELVLKAIQT